ARHPRRRPGGSEDGPYYRLRLPTASDAPSTSPNAQAGHHRAPLRMPTPAAAGPPRSALAQKRRPKARRDPPSPKEEVGRAGGAAAEHTLDAAHLMPTAAAEGPLRSDPRRTKLRCPASFFAGHRVSEREKGFET